MDYRHLLQLTCDHGIIQFAPHGEPDLNSGCTTDDNARAFLVALQMEGPDGERYARHYCDALFKAWRKGKGWCNWWLPERGFVTDLDSQDCQGRAFVASCMGLISGLSGVSDKCREMALDALSVVEELSHPRSKAYALIGCVLLTRALPEIAQRIFRVIERSADQMIDLYQRFNSPGWRWFDDHITYCNAILPQALFSYCSLRIDKMAQVIARDSLLFLGDRLLAKGYFNPVGNRGWWLKGKAMPLFDQQPVEACSMIMACREAFRITGQSDFRDMAEMAWQWYQGKNIHCLPLNDPETGGCYDGLTPDGLNRNQGAEAVISMLLANQVMETKPVPGHSLS